MRTARQPDGDDRSVYQKAVDLVDEGSIAAIVPVETPDGEAGGLFACGHDFTGAPYLKRNCYHRNPRRRALAAFAMVCFARKLAVEEDLNPLP